MTQNIYDEPTRITYYDLDGAGQLKISALLRMVHIAADQNANELHIGFKDLEPYAMAFVLQRFGLKTTRAPHYDEIVRIRTWPASIARGTFTRQGEMLDAHGDRLMEWTSLWVLLDLNARKILRPSALPVSLPEIGGLGISTEAAKICLPDGWGMPHYAYRHTVRYNEVDTNRHMNNTIYGDLIQNAVYELGQDAPADWSRLQINYLSETRLGEEIQVTCRKQDNLFLVTGTAHDQQAFLATLDTAR